MLKLRHLKYYILFIIIISILLNGIKFGDYCTGVGDGVLHAGLIFLFIIFWLISLIVNIYKIRVKGHSLEIPLIILVCVFSVSIWLVENYGNRRDREEVIAQTGIWDGKTYTGYKIKLYKSGYFDLIVDKGGHASTCYYLGKFKINGDTVNLMREDVKSLSNGFICTEYIIDSDFSIFTPIDKTFPILGKEEDITEIKDNHLSVYSDSVLVYNSELVQKDSLFKILRSLSEVEDSIHVNIYIDNGVKVGLVSEILELIRNKTNIKILYHKEEFH